MGEHLGGREAVKKGAERKKPQKGFFKNRTRDFMKHTWAAEAMEKASLLMHTRVHTHRTNEKNNINETAERRLPAEPQTRRSWAINHKLVAPTDVVPSSAGSSDLPTDELRFLSCVQIRNHSKPDCGQTELVVEACKLVIGTWNPDLIHDQLITGSYPRHIQICS